MKTGNQIMMPLYVRPDLRERIVRTAARRGQTQQALLRGLIETGLDRTDAAASARRRR